jgi:hypothetical protein
LKLWTKSYEEKQLGVKISKLSSPMKKKRLSCLEEQFPTGRKGLNSHGEKGTMFPQGASSSNVWQEITRVEFFSNQMLFIPLESPQNVDI